MFQRGMSAMTDEEAVFRHIMTYGPCSVWALAWELRLGVGNAERAVARLVERRLLYCHGKDQSGEVQYDWVVERPPGQGLRTR